MREHEFIGICNIADEDDEGFYLDKKGEKKDATLNLEDAFKKTPSNTLLLQKKSLLRLTADKGMNRNVVVNAIHLQDYSLNQIKKIIKKLTEELKKYKVKGVLEFHANDTTQQSYHFHFWTWKHYELKARAVITDFILENNYANFNNVKIEGDYLKQINKETSKEDIAEIKEKNKLSKINVEKEDEKSPLNIISTKEKVKERFRVLNESISFESKTIVSSSNESLPLDDVAIIKDRKINIFDSILTQAKKQKHSFGGVKVLNRYEDFNIDESSKRIEILKSKLKIFK